jgi:hypothetical protein
MSSAPTDLSGTASPEYAQGGGHGSLGGSTSLIVAVGVARAGSVASRRKLPERLSAHDIVRAGIATPKASRAAEQRS